MQTVTSCSSSDMQTNSFLFFHLQQISTLCHLQRTTETYRGFFAVFFDLIENGSFLDQRCCTVPQRTFQQPQYFVINDVGRINLGKIFLVLARQCVQQQSAQRTQERRRRLLPLIKPCISFVDQNANRRNVQQLHRHGQGCITIRIDGGGRNVFDRH